MKGWDWKRWPWTGTHSRSIIEGEIKYDNKVDIRDEEGRYRYQFKSYEYRKARLASLMDDYPDADFKIKTTGPSWNREKLVVVKFRAPSVLYEEVFDEITTRLRYEGGEE